MFIFRLQKALEHREDEEDRLKKEFLLKKNRSDCSIAQKRCWNCNCFVGGCGIGAKFVGAYKKNGCCGSATAFFCCWASQIDKSLLGFVSRSWNYSGSGADDERKFRKSSSLSESAELYEGDAR